MSHQLVIHRTRMATVASALSNASSPCAPSRSPSLRSRALFIIQTMNDCTLQGVDIHLKIFQTLLSLVTNFPTIHCRLPTNVRTYILCSLFSSLTDGLALLARFRLREPGTAMVSFTATASANCSNSHEAVWCSRG